MQDYPLAYTIDAVGYQDGLLPPTTASHSKVHRIQSVVLAAKESKTIEPTDTGIAGMIHELIEDKTIA